MCRRSCKVAVVALVALLVGCSADPHQEQDVSGNEHGSASQFDGQKSRILDSLNAYLVRAIRESRHGLVPYPMSRQYDWNSAFRNPEYRARYVEGYPKRNFDEIDRSQLDQFVRKRNFDEIDLSRMPLPYANK